jgi:beta-lactamase regulating signal transducer with metallopeptidase domain
MAGINNLDQFISSSTALIYWLFTWSCQALLLLGIAWGWLKLDRSLNATTRYRIWLVAIIAVSALPLLGAISRSLHLPAPLIPFPVGEIAQAPTPGELRLSARPAFSWASMIWPTLCTLWVAGVIFSLFRLGHSLWTLHLTKAAAHRVSLTAIDCSHADLLHSDAGTVSIALSERIKSPGVTGLFRPVILLPLDILSWTSREERTSILRHELAHIERRDHLASLFQSLLNALLFFHPLLRYACHELSLEREIACDDRVLSLGTEPKAYAEAILKAVERSFIPDLVHEAVSFTSRRTLERRIEMILNLNRIAPPLRPWRFLLLPIMLIGISTWLVIPGANSQSLSSSVSSPLASSANRATRSVSATLPQNQPEVNKATIMIDTVNVGTLLLQVRGLGALALAADGRLMATIQLPAPQGKDVQIGQPASVDTRNGIVLGKVIRKYFTSNESSEMMAIDLSLEGDLPQGINAGLSIDAVIEIARHDDVRYIGRPAAGKENSVSSLFKLEDGGTTAVRVPVRFGKSSVTRIEVLEGLEVGDKVIISEMSGYDGVNTIRLK